MITREDLRRDGADLRNRLFGPEAGTHSRTTPICGPSWLLAAVEPPAPTPDRTIAALAALCSVQR